MSGDSACIELTNLSFRWSPTCDPLLSIDNLSVNCGESLFIQGDSGSGKSTLLNILTGVLSPSSGNITILGHSLNSKSQSKRDQFRADHFGIIFQQFNLIPYLSILENVTLPLSFSGYKSRRTTMLENNIKDQALYLLDALGLDKNLANQNITQLSTGQQQRAAAARALIGSPEIIIADEPTSALDENAKHNFLELLFNQVKKFNSTLVFVSHDQSLSPMFDRTLSIHDFNPN